MEKNITIESLLGVSENKDYMKLYNITHDATLIIDLMASYLLPIETAKKALYDFCDNVKHSNINIDTFVEEKIEIYEIFYNINKEFYDKWNVNIQQGHDILFENIPVEKHIKKFVDKYLN